MPNRAFCVAIIARSCQRQGGGMGLKVLALFSSLLVVGCASISSPHPTDRTLFRIAHSDYESGDFKSAYRHFRSIAEDDDPFFVEAQTASMFYLGLIYSNGQGVKQNLGEAAKWYRLAAERGDGAAQHNLAIMHLEGRGIQQDRDEAIRLFRLAARQGLESSKSALQRLGVE